MTDIKTAYDNDYTGIYNEYISTNSQTNDCNNFGNYFNKCRNRSSQWGSTTESSGINTSINEFPCTSLFNNSTKRKSIVYYRR